MAAASAAGPLHQRAERGAALRSRVGEAVGVARVAVDGGDGRLELEHRLPVAVGQVVDGRGERIGRCHGGVVLLDVGAGQARLPATGDDRVPRARRSPCRLRHTGRVSRRRAASGRRGARSIGSSPSSGSRSARSGCSSARNRPQVVRLDDVEAARLERGPQQRRAVQLVAHELGPLRRDDEEADERIVGRDPVVAAEQRLAEHGRPLDLEQQRDLAADVPDAVDVAELLRRPADAAEVGAAARGRRAGRRGARRRCAASARGARARCACPAGDPHRPARRGARCARGCAGAGPRW